MGSLVQVQPGEPKKPQHCVGAFFVMVHWVYILYSRQLDLFYVGETDDTELRLRQHNDHFFPEAFTVRASDWVLHATLRCRDRSHARAIES